MNIERMIEIKTKLNKIKVLINNIEFLENKGIEIAIEETNKLNELLDIYLAERGG